MKVLITALLAAAFAFTANCQATTEREYLYMKKGYRQIEESGQDLINGYFTAPPNKQVNGSYTTTATVLHRLKDSTIAGTILKVVYSGSFSNTINYYAIPAVNLVSADSYGWQQFADDITAMSTAEAKAVLNVVAYQYAFYQRRKK